MLYLYIIEVELEGVRPVVVVVVPVLVRSCSVDCEPVAGKS